MDWSRRTFLQAAGNVVLWAGLPAPFALAASVEPYPLQSQIDGFRHTQALAKHTSAAGIETNAALALMAGIVKFFMPFQDPRGAILDPYEHAEKQYATPAFACAIAVLLAHGRAPELLGPCMKAMDRACADIELGHAADGHNDFYTGLLMQAWRLLKDHAPEARRALWTRHLAGIVPQKVYRVQPDHPHLNNWNLVAASGEWLRREWLLKPMGLTGGGRDNLAWILASLDRQMENFTPDGMYRDPHDPMAYDLFARVHVVEMLANGYNGRHAATLRTLMRRGALTSLLLQSPCGEIPCGGRSAHHQWNEAIHALNCEVYARDFHRQGDAALAGACRRSSALALQSMLHWQRPSGELWIVKNRFDPQLRWGYEGYSFHSQYNLLAAAKLGLALTYADDSIPARPCPAETGGFAFTLQPAFHKVIANAGGCYLEIDTMADAGYNPTGLLRLHRRGVHPQLTVSDGATDLRVYQTPERPSSSLAVGPAWQGSDGRWYSLAEHAGAVGSVSAAKLGGRGGLLPAVVQVQAGHHGQVEISVAYRGRFLGGATSVRQHFTLTSEGVRMRDAVGGDVHAVRAQLPLLTTDGRNAARISVEGHAAEAELGGSRLRCRFEEGSGTATRAGWNLPARNGVFDAALSPAHHRGMTYRLTPLSG